MAEPGSAKSDAGRAPWRKWPNYLSRLRTQPVDATRLRLHGSEACCNETETRGLAHRNGIIHDDGFVELARDLDTVRIP
ncbi:hypothetical protein [Burkholderia pyrrocinia]|uniref:hypothetical protein n=1 Tax=Burkholderia pyrrocinia TaxID=60550 RepID=UPI0030CDABC9